MNCLRSRSTGQGGVSFFEFSVAVILFILPLGALLDFGLYTFNAHNLEAIAREAARSVSIVKIVPVMNRTPLASCGEAVCTEVISKWFEAHPSLRNATVSIAGPTSAPAGSEILSGGVACNRTVSVTLQADFQFSILRVIGFRQQHLSRTVVNRWAQQPLCRP